MQPKPREQQVRAAYAKLGTPEAGWVERSYKKADRRFHLHLVGSLTIKTPFPCTYTPLSDSVAYSDMPLSAQSVQNVKSILDGSTSQGKSGNPGLVFVAVDRSGQTLVEHASGTKSIGSKEPVDLDTSFWIASMTKIVTTIALLQLVEQGKLSLDDPEQVKQYAPEIGQKKVYPDGATPQEQKGQVTLRMLLAHTSGFAYAFLDPRVEMYGRPTGVDEFQGDVKDILDSPMV
jgi:CubicO group peptidase (beta-lactamase class C family)